MNKIALKIHWIEYIFLIVVLLIVLVVLGKYISVAISGKDIVFNVEKLIIKHLNINKVNNHNNQMHTRNYILKADINGNWGLYNENILSHDYTVQNIDNKIGIERKLADVKSTGILVKIDDVRDYFSRSNIIATDIPFINSDKDFVLQEQEDLFPIIGYHNIFLNEEDIVDPYIEIRKNDFEEQLNFYNTNMNCRWFTLSELVKDYIIIKKKIPRNACVLTFDDGRKNNYHAVFPLLKQYNAKATFFIISGRVGQKAYMNNWEISKLYRWGNDIGSHSLLGGSLVDTSWYEQGSFTQDVLYNEINSSIELLNEFGYNTKLFAYPLGDYNNGIIAQVKRSGYIAARATQKNNPWRTPKALATSMNEDFIWHLNYYQPELKYLNELYSDIGYNGWWQFEEGFEILKDENNNVLVHSQVQPSKQSYGIVYLEDSLDTIANSYIVEKTGQYAFDIFASGNRDTGFKTLIDNIEVGVSKDLNQACVKLEKELYCHYKLQASLIEGEHFLTIINIEGKTGLDRFRIYRLVNPKTSYAITIEENL